MQIPLQLSRSPFVAYAGSLCGGIFIFFRLGVSVTLGYILLSAGALLMLSLFMWGRRVSYSLQWLHWIPFCLSFIGLGILTASFHRPIDASRIPAGALALADVDTRTDTDRGTRLEITLLQITPRAGKAQPIHTRAILYTDSTEATAGDRICFPALLDSPQGLESYQAFLFARGVDLTGSIRSEHIKIAPRPAEIPPAGKIRESLLQAIDHSSLNNDTKGFLKALLWGWRQEMSMEERDTFAAAGVAHLLAVSGLHVGLVVMLAGLLLLPLRFLLGRSGCSALLIAAIWSYVLLAGFGLPAVRAAIMATCVIIAYMLQRPGSAINSLCLAAFLILLFDPQALFDAGFLLSFSVTAAILLLSGPLTPMLSRKRRHLHSLLLWITVPLIAFLASWVLTGWYFHRVSLAFLPLNLLLSPLLPIYFGAALLHSLLMAMGFELLWLSRWLEAGYAGFTGLAESAGALPGARTEMWLPEAQVWLYFAALLLFAIWLHNKRRPLPMAACILMGLASAAALLLPTSVPSDSLTLLSRHDLCALHSIRGGSVCRRELPAGGVSCASLHGQAVVFLDSAVVGKRREPVRCHWLVVGGGYRHSIAEALHIFHPDSILLHASIFPSRRELLEQELRQLRHAAQKGSAANGARGSDRH